MSYLVKFKNAVRCLPVVYLRLQRLRRQTRIVLLGFVIALVLSGAVVWLVGTKGCSLVLYGMEN